MGLTIKRTHRRGWSAATPTLNTNSMETINSNTAAHSVDVPRLVPPCECRDWCRDGCDMMSLHHPRCQHYAPPPADPRYARFGEAMWKYITNLGGDFCGEELSEDILPLAQSAGLCCRVEYDPAIHGEGIEADPGSEIWYWGNADDETREH